MIQYAKILIYIVHKNVKGVIRISELNIYVKLAEKKYSNYLHVLKIKKIYFVLIHVLLLIIIYIKHGDLKDQN